MYTSTRLNAAGICPLQGERKFWRFQAPDVPEERTGHGAFAEGHQPSSRSENAFPLRACRGGYYGQGNLYPMQVHQCYVWRIIGVMYKVRFFLCTMSNVQSTLELFWVYIFRMRFVLETRGNRPACNEERNCKNKCVSGCNGTTNHRNVLFALCSFIDAGL